MDESAPPGRRTLLVLGIAIGLLVVGGIVLRVTAPSPDPVGAVGSAAAALEVGSLEVAKVLRPDRVVVSGVLEARRSVRISSETSGRVLEIGAEALDRVAEGQMLVRIDPLLARVAVDRAEAAVTRATSELALANAGLDRQQSLKERSVASESAFDDASNRSRVAEAAIRDARAQRDQARDELSKKTLRAPFAGVLRSFRVERGEVVSVGQEIGELLDLATARVTIGLSDRQIVSLEPGMSVSVEAEAYPNESFSGRILRVGAAADEGSKRFPAEIEIDNVDRRLLPGMVARIELSLDAKQPRLLLPREALIREFGLGFVFVIEAEEGGGWKARQRRVSARDLPFDPTLIEVSSGLRDGERVAVSGVRALRDGVAVRSHDAALGSRLVGGEADGDAS
jgi:RND family efflux transporter MFP subunit